MAHLTIALAIDRLNEARMHSDEKLEMTERTTEQVWDQKME